MRSASSAAPLGLSRVRLARSGTLDGMTIPAPEPEMIRVEVELAVRFVGVPPMAFTMLSV